MMSNGNTEHLHEYQFLSGKWYTKGHKWWMLGHVAKHRNKIVLITFFSLLSIILQIFIPFIMGAVFEYALPVKDSDFIVAAGTMVMLLGLFKLF